MRLRARLLLLFIIVFVVLGLAIHGMRQRQRQTLHNLFRIESDEKTELLDAFLNARSRLLKIFVNDYSLWTEMAEFVRSRDVSWASRNIDGGIATSFQLTAAWVFSPGFELCYFTQSAEEDEGVRGLLTEPAVLDRVRAAKTVHFFTFHHDTLFEIYGASIQAEDDVERLQPAGGYVFAAQKWDEAFLAESAAALDVRLSIERQMKAFDSDWDKNILTFFSVCAGLDGRPIAFVQAVHPSRFSAIAQQERANIAGLFVLLLALVTAIAVCVLFWINRPFALIRQALLSGQPEPLVPLNGRNDEFGEIARLITASFSQRKILAEEIGRRKQQEEQLHKKDRLMETVAACANFILEESNSEHAVRCAMKMLGETVDVSRVYLFEDAGGDAAANAGLHMVQRYEWCSAQVQPQLADPGLQDFTFPGNFRQWQAQLQQGIPVKAIVRELPPDVREHLQAQQIQAILLVPLTVHGRIWGMIGFDECRCERNWSDLEIAALSAAGMALSNAIMRRRAEESLRSAKDAAERANKSKSEFIANMSHEIRTPMNALLGFVELLRETQLTQQQREYLNTAAESGQLLLMLLNDILDLAKIEAGHISLEEIPFGFEYLVSSVLQMLRPRVEAKSLSLAVDLDPQLPRLLLGDPVRIRQIFLNLLNNAIKFTDTGGISVRGYCREDPADAGSVTLTCQIADTGIGISPEKIAGLFKPFSQADSSTTRRYGGSGLGLYIVKSLVARMGGDISVRSMPEKGSEFTFSIRLKHASGVPAPLVRVATTLQSVVMLEPYSIDQKVLKKFFKQMNMRVASVLSRGADAAAVLAANPPDLLTVELSLPDADAFVLVAALRQDPRLQALKILAVSAVASAGVAKRCKDAGLNGYLSKPVTLVELKLMCNCLASGSDAFLTRHSIQERSFDSTAVLIVEDNLINVKLMTVMLERFGCRVTAAEDGERAIACVREQPFSVIFMDMQMPKLSGVQATEYIRQKLQQTVPIIGLSADTQSESKDMALAAGMNDYLSKPVTVEAIRQILNLWV
ncbi:MAG: response regulator [Candidatus Omnitrophica bacterium]|nr:response regulator [Candidatus Omnitrophota bacterium]